MRGLIVAVMTAILVMSGCVSGDDDDEAVGDDSTSWRRLDVSIGQSSVALFVRRIDDTLLCFRLSSAFREEIPDTYDDVIFDEREPRCVDAPAGEAHVRIIAALFPPDIEAGYIYGFVSGPPIDGIGVRLSDGTAMVSEVDPATGGFVAIQSSQEARPEELEALQNGERVAVCSIESFLDGRGVAIHSCEDRGVMS